MQDKSDRLKRAIEEVRSLREDDANNWRVIFSPVSKQFEAFVPDYWDCITDDTRFVKTNRLESREIAETIALVLNTLSQNSSLDSGEPFQALNAFICLLRYLSIWR